MAIYHTRVKTFSRAQGHASTAAAAYRAGILIVDVRTGLKHDYRRRGGVVETRCIAPDEAPDWAFDPRELWPAAEASEKRKDATVAREFEIALPHEMTDEERSALTADVARALVERYRFAIQASIHAPQTPDGLNYHAHLLATTRRIGDAGLADKTRELDGGPSGRGEVEWIREMVARTTNAHLAAAQLVARVDHRSLKEQAAEAAELGDETGALALERKPTQHVGKNATALHRRGVECHRTHTNEAIAHGNEAKWRAALAQMEGQGRLQAASAGHSHDQARRDHAAAVLAPVSGVGHIRVVRGLGPPKSTATPREKHQATWTALAESISLWREGFVANIDLTFKATTQLLAHGAERVATFVHAAAFRADLRALVKQLKRVKHDALRFKRRLQAEDRAKHLLHHAEYALEQFEGEHPKPRYWSRTEWTKCRDRRLRAVQSRRDVCRRAHLATEPQAQRDYEAMAKDSAEHLEALSRRLLARYPVPPDQQLPAPTEPALEEMQIDPAKPVVAKPRLT